MSANFKLPIGCSCNLSAGSQTSVGSPHISFIGMMGSGKTTIARLFASAINTKAIDLDTVFVTHHQMAISQAFETMGEAWFRNREREILLGEFASSSPTIFSPGGGALLDDQSRRVMAERSVVFWLRAEAETIIARIGNAQNRPLLANNPKETITRLIETRRSTYHELAHVIVDVDGLTPNQTVECVESALEMVKLPYWTGKVASAKLAGSKNPGSISITQDVPNV